MCRKLLLTFQLVDGQLVIDILDWNIILFVLLELLFLPLLHILKYAKAHMPFLFSFLEYHHFIWNTNTCRYIFWEPNFLTAVMHALHVPAKMGGPQQWWTAPPSNIRESYRRLRPGSPPERRTTKGRKSRVSNSTKSVSSSAVSWKRG